MSEAQPISETVAEGDSAGMVKGIFDIPELKIMPSPDAPQNYTFPDGEKITDYDVSPEGTNVAALVINRKGNHSIKFWRISENHLTDSLQLPNGLAAKAIVWHPKANALFVMGVRNSNYEIFKIQKHDNRWTSDPIFSTPHQIRRLLVCPRPFITGYDEKKECSYFNYRLFFGMDNGDKTYRIVSVTENGNRFYQVVGPARTFTTDPSKGENPSRMESDGALPMAFHPAGHQLIWEDQSNNFYCASYDSKYWGNYKPVKLTIASQGTITPTPNGLGFLHWQKGIPGIGVYLLTSETEDTQLSDFQFVATPSSTPDGKGIVGLTFSGNRYTLNYLPIRIPLADVSNAWMFATSKEEMDLFQKNSGLFRPNRDDQLYKLYESENYYCNNYDRNSPTRPYLVTTDIFWELFGAAYEGMFILKERDEAIPNFWKFIASANDWLKDSHKKSAWKAVFSLLRDYHAGNFQNPEVKRIQNEKDDISGITKKEYAFSDLKPRGHYTSSPELSQYFKAFRYFTTILQEDRNAVAELNSLSEEAKAFAGRWIESYSGFISPSRSPLVWDNLKSQVPRYCSYPQPEPTIFPLSWGFDNEVLCSTVYHPDVPQHLQIPGRMLPSGLDLASVLGDGFAEKLLGPDYAKYPNLRNVIVHLRENWEMNVKNSENRNNLYASWLDAMAVQWADSVKPAGGKGNELWQTKRLQTGLATWATLRHATILVNERTAAECGEGGFEEILMKAPRGYVEPDPETFGAIAGLFEKAVQHVSASLTGKPDFEEMDSASKQSLYDGIIFRLKEVARQARLFQTMAEKEKKGEALSNEEYENILFIARVAEHNFLVFNSLSNKDYALSNPDPIAKIADAAGGGELHLPYLLVAVGNSMEWDPIVPFYGRYEIVKGSVYSYYELESRQILNDKEWQEKVTGQEFLPWIKPFITSQKALGMAKTLY